MVFDEGTFWTDEQPAYEIARLTASIEQVAKWHENSGQRAIIEDCKRIRALLKGVTA